MCLIVNSKYHDVLHWESDPFIAQTDLLVFKELRKTGCLFHCYLTPYQRYPVKFIKGIAKLSIPNTVKISIEDFKFVVKEGIHASLNVDYLTSNIYFAVIPKGTSYYIGEEDDIVSDELLIFKNKKVYEKYIEQGHLICLGNELYYTK